MNFSPKADNEKAGLVIFQDESHFYYLCQSTAQGKNVLQLFKSKPKEKAMDLLTEVPLASKTGKVRLRIASTGSAYSFSFSEDTKNWKLLKDNVDAKFLSTKEAGGFIGCLYGMYATSSGEPTTNTASFQYLTYMGDDPMYRK